MGLLTALDSSSNLPSAATASNLAAKLQLCRVNLFPQQASDALLELAILAGVDERVDAAVDEHQHHGEVVEPGREVECEHADGTQEVVNLNERPACDESAANHQ